MHACVTQIFKGCTISSRPGALLARVLTMQKGLQFSDYTIPMAICQTVFVEWNSRP